MAAIEFHEDANVRIGRNLYRVRYEEHPRPGFHKYSIETSGNPTHDKQEKFEIADLRDVYFADFPDSFSLHAYDPRFEERIIDSLWLQKDDGIPQMTLSFSHYYVEWTHPKNLIHFYHDLSASLIENSPYRAEVEIDPDECGVSARVTFQAVPSDDLLSHIAKATRHIGKVVQKHLILESSPPMAAPKSGSTASPPPLKPDEHGWKWWLRFIVLPVGIALIALVAAFAKFIG